MNISFIIPGFFLGAASSLHCMGMCGPLSLAIPVSGKTPNNKAITILSYQTGRISTYGLIGILSGLLGTGILLAGYQQNISIITGLVILISAAGYFAGKKAKARSFMNGFHKFLSRLMFRLLNNARQPGGAFLFGMANGLLPCGMVYMAAIAATSAGNIIDAFIFMLMFGAGTLPAMLLTAYAGNRPGWSARKWMGKLSPYIVAGMGVLLIVRGLNLDIPYLSPAFTQANTGSVACRP